MGGIDVRYSLLDVGCSQTLVRFSLDAIERDPNNEHRRTSYTTKGREIRVKPM
jgi:hypothetical protein